MSGSFFVVDMVVSARKGTIEETLYELDGFPFICLNKSCLLNILFSGAGAAVA